MANGWGGRRKGSGAKARTPVIENTPCVYVVGAIEAPHVCKVGISRHLTRRIATIQTGHWMKLSIVAAFEMPDWRTAATLEEAVLVGYAKHGIRGEWFSINPVVMSDAMRILISKIGLPSKELITGIDISEWGLKLIKEGGE